MLLSGKTRLFLILLLLAKAASGQSGDDIFRQNSSTAAAIKVIVAGQEQAMPWCGGANNPQFALADLNKDGKNDLVIFEQFIGVRSFLASGSGAKPVYKYAPEYETCFPDVKNYMLMQDANQDGIADLFHYGSSGVVYCKGFYNSEQQLCFDAPEELRYTTGQTPGTSAIDVNTTDIPAIVDVDHDGDLDIVTFFMWGAYLYQYQNMQVELGLPPGTFELKLADRCWGKIFQGIYRQHDLGYSCSNAGLKPVATGEKTTHGSNVVCLFDYDGDGDYDYLGGNSSFAESQFLRNGKWETGYAVDTMVAQDTVWKGSGTPLYMPNYPHANWLDIDADGDNDLLFAPHSRGTESYRCIALYENIGTASAPVYTYRSDTFLIDQMIDAGSGAYPMLYDYNRDGKQDLFVGNQGYYQPQTNTFRSSILYYENTSVGQDIRFTLRTRNFLDVHQLNITGAIPAVGDINSDGLDDLVLGMLDGSLLYFENKASVAGDVPDWQLVPGHLKDENGAEISVGGFAAPFIYDMDKDGHKDLIIGNRAGTLVYYRNNGGAPGAHQLTHKTDTLGGVRTAPPISSYGYSVPFIGSIDNTGKEYLLLGSQLGEIYRYDGFQNGNTTGAYTRLDTAYSEIRVKGEYTAVTAADLNGDGKYEMFIGNILGGLYHYSQLFNATVPNRQAKTASLTLYPNPAGDELTILGLPEPDEGRLTIYNAMGRVVYAHHGAIPQGTKVNTSGLPAGVYHLSVQVAANYYTARFVKQ